VLPRQEPRCADCSSVRIDHDSRSTTVEGDTMNDADAQRIASLLEAIRDGQTLQLQRQAEALTLQREQAEMARKQFERAEKLQDRAEALQARGAQVITVARRAVTIVVPVLVLLIIYVSWLMFFR